MGMTFKRKKRSSRNRPVPDGLFEIPVRGRDDPDIELPDLGIPDPAAFPFLEETEQLDLHRRRDLSDFVEKGRAAVGGLEDARMIPDGPGEGPPDMAEQLRFQQVFRDRPAIDRHDKACLFCPN